MPVEDPATAFRIVILGDFSGRENRGESLSSRPRSWRIDRDNFDSILEKLNVQLRDLFVLPGSGPIQLAFQDLDSFHPDQLVDQLPIFASLRDIRERLYSTEDFQSAADEVLSWGNVAPPSDSGGQENPPAEPAPTPASSPAAELNLLDQILEPGNQPIDNQQVSEWQSMIEAIVSPYLVPGVDPRQAELVGCVDEAIQVTMNAILHHPDFRQLESAWRSLQWIVRHLETSPQLSLHVVDISKSELAKDLATANSLRDAELHRLLVEESVETPGAEPWATIIGNYEFDRSDQDLALLAGMGSIAKASGAPFIAAAAAELIGCSGPSDDVTLNLDGLSNNSAWQELRASPTAAYLGLAWPKFLVRLPYGSATRPIDTFDYEELAGKTGETANVNLLWGNSAFLAALLLGQAYSESDWSMQPGDCLEVEGLPAWTYEEDGEPQLHPCGQYLLTQRPIESLQSAGFMPIVSIRDSDTIRLGGFYSLMSKRLSGPWD